MLEKHEKKHSLTLCPDRSNFRCTCVDVMDVQMVAVTILGLCGFFSLPVRSQRWASHVDLCLRLSMGQALHHPPTLKQLCFSFSVHPGSGEILIASGVLGSTTIFCSRAKKPRFFNFLNHASSTSFGFKHVASAAFAMNWFIVNFVRAIRAHPQTTKKNQTFQVATTHHACM